MKIFKRLIPLACVGLVAASIAAANDIYITQVGDTLDLDIVQNGQNNVIGTTGQAVVLNGDAMTFSITQTGGSNSIAANIKGVSYTGTWVFTGSNNSVALLCSSASAANCDTVVLNITAVGDDQAYDIKIGESASADQATINFTVTDDNNIITTDVDGTSAVINVTINKNSSTAGNSTLDIDLAGNGDINGHTITFNALGRGHAVVLNQSGIYDNVINLSTNGDNHAININQSD